MQVGSCRTATREVLLSFKGTDVSEPALNTPNAPQVDGPLDLLTERDFVKPGWELTIGMQRAFYIRGVTRFRINILNRMTELLKLSQETLEDDALFSGKSNWKIRGFDWQQPFSPRQAMDALSLRARRPLRFDKAVKVILLCDSVAKTKSQENGSSLTDNVLEFMKIEPAVYYLPEFNENMLALLQHENRVTMRDLRDATGQPSATVFFDMALGKTVTRSLAQKVCETLNSLCPDIYLGKIESTYSRDHTGGASLVEALAD